METTQSDLRKGDYQSEPVRDNFGDEDCRIRASSDESYVGYVDINHELNVSQKPSKLAVKFRRSAASSPIEPNLNSIQRLAADSSVFDASRRSSVDDEFPKIDNRSDTYDISSVVIPNDILEELSRSVKEKSSYDQNRWRRDSVDFRESAKNRKIVVATCDEDSPNPKNVDSRDGDVDFVTVAVEKKRVADGRKNCDLSGKKSKRATDARKKFYETESDERRSERLAYESARRREMRMYYESPEQRRKRLDAEAARKRDYRMYNEPPDDRRKRLDREAERRRSKRSTICASETAEQRRERLNRESAKRREARSNQYARETDEQRRERLRKDASRAREMRFTRSAIETADERGRRLVKDALRKRELRMHGETSIGRFTELQTVKNFVDDSNDSPTKDDSDDRSGGHYLSNWMMWFQNTLTQTGNSADKTDGNEANEETHL